MKTVFYAILISLSIAGCATNKPVAKTALTYSLAELKPQARSTNSKKNFSEKTYVSLDLPVKPFEKIKREIEKSQNLRLQSRGEAHITLLTPPEFKNLARKISPQELQAWADKQDLEKAPYKLLCVGEGRIKNNDRELRTFYAVVESERLFAIRQSYLELFIKHGGDTNDFAPENYYPHVTIGYTHRDLHFEEGVVKDVSSCIFNLKSEN